VEFCSEEEGLSPRSLRSAHLGSLMGQPRIESTRGSGGKRLLQEVTLGGSQSDHSLKRDDSLNLQIKSGQVEAMEQVVDVRGEEVDRCIRLEGGNGDDGLLLIGQAEKEWESHEAECGALGGGQVDEAILLDSVNGPQSHVQIFGPQLQAQP
jgi:hypothetical protein